jgi:WD40 repeat protein
LLALGESGNDVQLEDVQHFSPIARLHGPAAPGSNVEQVAFNPDGQLLAALSSTGVLSLWNLRNRTLVSSFQAFSSPAQADQSFASLAFSSDGQVLAASLGKQFDLWYAGTREPIVALQRDSADVSNLALSPDGQLLLEAEYYGVSGPVLVRLATLPGWQARACAIANRNFTLREWQQIFASKPYQKVCPSLPAPLGA